MNLTAGRHFTVATDIADAVIAAGVTARRAHEAVGGAVRAAESDSRSLSQCDVDALSNAFAIGEVVAPLDAHASVRAKRTSGSTNPVLVELALASLRSELSELQA